MSEADALLAAILAAPDDDLPRLVFADWCEEHGDAARAEFIRTEIELARMQPEQDTAPEDWEQPRYRPLCDRARSLWDANAPRWYPGLDRLAEEIDTHRGFPFHAAGSVRRFLQHGQALFETAPTIVDIFLDRLGKNTPALAACPALIHVQRLTFFETPFRAREAEQFFASPHLANLRSFEVPFTDTQMGPRGAVALARSRSLVALEDLDLFNHGILDTGAAALFAADALASLRRLRLGNNGLTDRTAFALAGAGRLNQLRSLALDRNHLMAQGVATLCQADHLAGLEHLDLGDNPIGGACVTALSAAVFAGRLRGLRLWDCHLDDASLTALFTADRLAGLASLNVTSNPLGARAAGALAHTRAFPELKTLYLSACSLTPALAGVLGRASLPALRHLTLSHNPLGADGVRQLLAGPLVDPLVRLDLDRIGLHDEGAEALASARPLLNLRTLWLSDNGLTDRAARALADSNNLPGLRSLSLHRNPITDTGKAILRERFGPDACYF